MQGYTHIIIGLGASLVITEDLGPLEIVMATLGSLLPDLDHPKSILGKRFPFGPILGIKHRGWMHSLLGLAVFSIIAAIIDPVFVPSIALGYFLHLIADSLNPTGIAWFYPIIKKRMHIIGIRTGGTIEYAIVLVIICGIAFYLSPF